LKLFPTGEQWHKWALPSKITYAGFLVTILGVLLAIVVFGMQTIGTGKSEQRIMTKFEQLFTENEPDWLRKYPSGFIMFGTERTKLVDSAVSAISSKYDIIWSDARVKEYSDSQLVFVLPDIVWRAFDLRFPAKEVGVVFPKTGRRATYVELNYGLPDKICFEVVDARNDRCVFLIGFKPGRAQAPPWDSLHRPTFGELYEFVHAMLRQRYPSGYVLFMVQDTSIIVPRAGWETGKYGMNWRTARVDECTRTSIVLRLPDMTFETCSFSGNTVGIKTNAPIGQPMPLPVDFGWPDRLIVEILDKGETGYFLVLGLVPRHLLD
jgi:hypothetical protein